MPPTNNNNNSNNENVEEVPVSPEFQRYSTLPNAEKLNYLKSLPIREKKALEEELKKFTLPVVKLKMPPGSSGGRRTRARTRKAKRHAKKRRYTRKH